MQEQIECEIRWKLKNFGKFQDKLKKKGWELKGSFQAVDYFFQPKYGEFWNPEKKQIKIREWKKPTPTARIYLNQNNVEVWKGNTYQKVFPDYSRMRLFQGTLNQAKFVIKNIGFEEWMLIEILDGRIWNHQKTGRYMTLEKLKKRGWTGKMNFAGKTARGVDAVMKTVLSDLKIPRRTVRIKQLIVELTQREGRNKKPSKRAKKLADEELQLRTRKEEFQFKKRMKKFEKHLEKSWKKQEKEREKEDAKTKKDATANKNPKRKKATKKKTVKKKVVKKRTTKTKKKTVKTSRKVSKRKTTKTKKSKKKTKR